MAHDLILGRTPRDWSCGGAAPAPTQENRERLPSAPRLAEEVRALVTRTTARVIRGRKRGRVPEADWQAARELHRRWLKLSDARRGRWRESDSLPLRELRESAGRLAGRLDVLEESSRGRALAPASPAPAPAPSTGPWYAALGAALTLAGVGIYSNLKGGRT